MSFEQHDPEIALQVARQVLLHMSKALTISLHLAKGLPVKEESIKFHVSLSVTTAAAELLELIWGKVALKTEKELGLGLATFWMQRQAADLDGWELFTVGATLDEDWREKVRALM